RLGGYAGSENEGSGKREEGSGERKEGDETATQATARRRRTRRAAFALPASLFPLPARLPAIHDFLPSISLIDFAFLASCTNRSSSASSYASAVIDAFFVRSASIWSSSANLSL